MNIDLLIGSDHRGYELKEQVEKHICPIDKDIELNGLTMYGDVGPYDKKTKVDYPDIVKKMVLDMKTSFNRGILICGSGFGVAMAANRYPHIRAVTVRTKQEAVMARKHNDANVLCLGADFTPKNVAFDIIDAFLKTPFEGGRHQKRLDKFNV